MATKTATAVNKTEVKKKERPQSLRRESFGLFQHKRQIHNAYIPHGVTFEEAMHPFYWSFVARSVRDNDRIEMVAEDGTWMASCHVKAATTNSVNLVKIQYIKFQAQERAYAIDDWTVKYNGPSHRWVFIDPLGEIVDKGFKTEHDAMKALTQYRHKIAA